MQRPNTSAMRHRTPSLVQKVETQYSLLSNKSGTVNNVRVDAREVVTSRKTDSMYDVVVPKFKERSAAGEIFNNPMYRATEDMSFPLSDFIYDVKGHSNSGVARFQFNAPSYQLRLDDSDFKLLSQNAITDAYAEVTANEGNTPLWIGELRESVKMLFDIGKGARALYEKTRKERKRWAKGKMSTEEAQSFTLSILYGILPIEQQIADFYEGLFAVKQDMSRQTARGKRADEWSRSKFTQNLRLSIDSYAGATYECRQSENLSVSVRAGVLFDIDFDEVPFLALILEPRAIVSTAYALARLSFVIDWFINVGGTLAAWSPKAGVSELSAWATVESSHTIVASFATTPSSFYKGQGQYHRTTTEKWRVPVTRSELPIIPRWDLNLDVEKVLAMVLLFAKIRKAER